MTMMESINTTGVSRIEQPNMGKKQHQNISQPYLCNTSFVIVTHHLQNMGMDITLFSTTVVQDYRNPKIVI